VLHPFTLDDAAFATFVEALGWLAPFYVEKIAHLIKPGGAPDASGRPTARVADVTAAFNAILAPQYRNYFVTWEEHLSKNFRPGEAAAMRHILDICAEQPAGEQFDTLLGRLNGSPSTPKRKTLRDNLNILVTDGYLSELTEGDTMRFCFRSGMLRRYWQRHLAN
jgi:hypothetical protein